ncbi:hypothetical protein EVAR_87484_1 [Eumeta japonica]|uniref:Uncharacterized protein n=1 Tax=Eumeta variegata TaxID=151549 RepID=A0A4C1W0F4_EUMVA|nr:hypothetical protein EVAR_87484_1 [Eumeta japonica]
MIDRRAVSTERGISSCRRVGRDAYRDGRSFEISNTGDKTEIQCTPEADQAYVQYKQSLKDVVTSSHPRADPSRALHTEAGDTCAGAVLQQ